MALTVNPQNWNEMMKGLTEFLLQQKLMNQRQRGSMDLLEKQQQGSMGIVQEQNKGYRENELLRHENIIKTMSQDLADKITLMPVGQRLQVQAHIAKSKGEDPTPYIDELRGLVTNEISGAQGLLGGASVKDLSPEEQSALSYLEEATIKTILGDLGAQATLQKRADEITKPTLAAQDRQTDVRKYGTDVEGYKAETDRMKLIEEIKAGPGATKGGPKPSDWNSLYDRLMADEKELVKMMSDLELDNIGGEMSPENKQEYDSLSGALANIQAQKTEIMNSYRSSMGLPPLSGAAVAPPGVGADAGATPEQTLQQTVEILMSKYKWPYEKAYRRAYAAIYGKEPGTEINR